MRRAPPKPVDAMAGDGADEATNLLRIPMSQQVVRGVGLHRQLRDPTIQPSRTRVMSRDDTDMPVVGEELTSMGEMIVCRDGGSLRTFNGRQAHENGWWPSFKRRRLQHWQGSAQRSALMWAECDFKVNWAQTESRRFHFVIGNTWYEYTCDLEIDMFDAPTEIVEIKRDDRALEDPDYRLKLAGVDEICRRIGMRFRIVMADEIFACRQHRDNVELFASRRFAAVDRDHLHRLENHALKKGRTSSYREVASVLDPRCPARGTAVLQALVVRRRVEIDLTKFLTDRTPVTIH